MPRELFLEMFAPSRAAYHKEPLGIPPERFGNVSLGRPPPPPPPLSLSLSHTHIHTITITHNHIHTHARMHREWVGVGGRTRQLALEQGARVYSRSPVLHRLGPKCCLEPMGGLPGRVRQAAKISLHGPWAAREYY